MAQNHNWVEYEINNSRWVVPDRYTNLTPLGQGAYGLVWYAFPLLSLVYLS